MFVTGQELIKRQRRKVVTVEEKTHTSSAKNSSPQFAYRTERKLTIRQEFVCIRTS